MNLKNHPDLRDQLAAEYALGTLKGGARRRFEAWLRDDAALRQATAAWQDRLAPLAQLAPAVAPPAGAWSAIEQRVGLAPARTPFWRAALSWWQGAALVCGTAAVVLSAVLVQRTRAPSFDQVATLMDDKAQAALVVAADRRHRTLDVRLLPGVAVPDDRTLQLWAITRAGQPRSLGIVADNHHARLPLNDRAVGSDVVLLAISLEPKGGSPNPNAPTGPVLWKGGWVTL